ncbi:sigma-70 family RNA polymerase sigma factor [Robertmurraya korlensis]|uniref:sigma-70 family RNA polymerase sigma factor n=1 Tax=Robertmurraya korlensis TaxID=519977 RepID=UPI0008271CBF|nr:sigma-70 family RNA polymerase sigma factor [Robertmurraya korlensis]
MIEKIKNNEATVLSHLNSQEKLAWLMKEYGNDIIRIAYTYLKQEQLAEDVAQEVFIKCYEKLDTFRNESSYKTWLIKITVNKCKDVLRSWSYRNLLVTDFIRENLISYSKEPKEIDDKKELVSSKVIELPVKLREVIILYYFQELTIEEISELLEVHSTTVRTRMHRGRLKLKEMFKGESNHG